MTTAATPAVTARSASYPAVLAVVVLSTCVSLAAYTGPLGNAVTLAEAFHASAGGLSWVLASMSVGLAVTLLPAGVLADRIGRRRVFQIGAALFVASSIVCALANEVTVFVTARIVGGVGVTGMIATGLGLVASVSSHGRHQATTATWWSVAMGAGIAAGPVIVGTFDLFDGWRWFYLLLAAAGIATWAIARAILPHQGAETRNHREFDVLGFALLLAFLAVLITAIVEVRTGAFALVVALFITSAVLLCALIVSQSRGRRQLVTADLFTHRPFVAATLAGLGSGLGIISIMAYAPTFLVGALGMSTLAAGSITVLWSGTSSIAALAFGRFTARITGTTHLVLGLTGVAIGMLLMLNVSTTSDVPRLAAGFTVAGLASGLLNGALARQSVATVPTADAATGTAANNTARYLGAAIGVSAASMIATGSAITTGWNYIACAGATVSVATAIAVIALHRRSLVAGPPAR